MSNSYYNHTTYPSPNSPGSSAALRFELQAITDGFNLLPTLAGNGYKVAMVNAGGTALVASSALQSLAITSSTIDGTPVGATTASTGRFTGITVVGGAASLGSSVTIAGGTINGTTIGATTPSSGAFTTASASGGFTGNLTGNVTGSVTGNVTGDLTGNVTGNVTATSGTSTFNNVTINGTLDMNSGSAGTITGLAAPTTDSDAANKAYVDSVVQGLDAKASCRAATTANITLSGTQTIDGVALIAGDRVLVKNQSTTSQNGIYVVASGGWTRATDADTWNELVSAFTFVEDGTNGADNGYLCTVDTGGTLGSTAVAWVQFSAAGQITAGAGMTKSGNTLDVGTASASRIVVNADNIDLAASGITPGTYRSLTIDSYGRATAGTNPTTLAGYGITDAYTKTEIDTILGSTASAAASASAAAASALDASNSATAASGSASAALTSANNAAASYDAFDDRYLGDKTSNPTLDNDGNALLTGALYWNSSAGEMRVYTGSAWLSAYLPGAAYLQLSGGTMTGTITFAAGQTIATANNLSSGVLGSVPYQSAAGTTALLAPNTGATRNFLRMTGTGSAGAAPAWDTVTKTDVGLANVENTALSTWAGSANITTLGAVATGTWNATVIGLAYGGTGATSAANARTNLGLAIGTNVQAYDADLAAIAALSGTSGLLKKTAANTWSLDTSAYLTGNQNISITGDATGSGATSIALTLANSGVTAGTYTKVTVDAKGRVTSGTTLASADIPTYTGSLTSLQVTNALGYTPYSISNPSGYITSSGSVAYATNAGNITSTQSLLGYSLSGVNIDYSGQGGPQVQGQGSGAAMMSFHRPGAYAINFGLGTDNQLRTGGWSRGGNYVILDSGNYNSYAPTLTGGNASGTWGISISGNAATAGTAAAIASSSDIQLRSLGVNTAVGAIGEIRATNNITAYYSDERLKTKLGPIEGALAKLRTLSGFYYQANEIAQALGYDVKKEVGVSAQEVRAVMPEVVAAAPISDEYLTVRYERLVPLLIEAIKELADAVDSLRK